MSPLSHDNNRETSDGEMNLTLDSLRIDVENREFVGSRNNEAFRLSPTAVHTKPRPQQSQSYPDPAVGR